MRGIDKVTTKKKKDTTDPTPFETPSFSEFITDLDNGSIDQTLTERMAEVTKAVEETGKVGELTIKLTIRKEGKMATVHPEIKTKIPEHGMHATLFHVGDNGELLREDPKQLRMKALDKPGLRAIGGNDDDEDGED